VYINTEQIMIRATGGTYCTATDTLAELWVCGPSKDMKRGMECRGEVKMENGRKGKVSEKRGMRVK